MVTESLTAAQKTTFLTTVGREISFSLIHLQFVNIKLLTIQHLY